MFCACPKRTAQRSPRNTPSCRFARGWNTSCTAFAGVTADRPTLFLAQLSNLLAGNIQRPLPPSCPSHAGTSDEREDGRGVGQDATDVGEEARGLLAVHDPMVERQCEGENLA